VLLNPSFLLQELLARDIDAFPTYFASGTARSILANRISYFFDWHGPSMTIDTACSSSLFALHLAVQSLRSGESPTAVVAGANLVLAPDQFVAESKLNMLSPDGRSRMWDKEANGYARGDGVAALVLKTLSAAIADGDSIECIIRETGVNQDGRTKGITMPSPIAQANLIWSTYKNAGLDLAKKEDRPQYFEAHGTGECSEPLFHRPEKNVPANTCCQAHLPVIQSRPRPYAAPSSVQSLASSPRKLTPLSMLVPSRPSSATPRGLLALLAS
jgi:acyl transferase domain-containing protein